MRFLWSFNYSDIFGNIEETKGILQWYPFLSSSYEICLWNLSDSDVLPILWRLHALVISLSLDPLQPWMNIYKIDLQNTLYNFLVYQIDAFSIL